MAEGSAAEEGLYYALGTCSEPDRRYLPQVPDRDRTRLTSASFYPMSCRPIRPGRHRCGRSVGPCRTGRRKLSSRPIRGWRCLHLASGAGYSSSGNAGDVAHLARDGTNLGQDHWAEVGGESPSYSQVALRALSSISPGQWRDPTFLAVTMLASLSAPDVTRSPADGLMAAA